MRWLEGNTIYGRAGKELKVWKGMEDTKGMEGTKGIRAGRTLIVWED